MRQPKIKRIRQLSPWLSKWLRTYYVSYTPRLKYRLWHAMRLLTGYARLQVQYANTGWITLDERDYVQREILVSGYYEPEVWETLAAYASSDEVLWDVGAHIGSLAIRAKLDSRFREIHCFEPNECILPSLKVNLKLNTGHHAIYPIALSDRNERHELHFGPPSNTGMTSIVEDWQLGGQLVECRTVDELIQSEGLPTPTLMKIDVEGWEAQVLAGASELLSRQPPKAIALEMAATPDGEVMAYDAQALLYKSGYVLTWIKRPDGHVEPRENYLAVCRSQ